MNLERIDCRSALFEINDRPVDASGNDLAGITYDQLRVGGTATNGLVLVEVADGFSTVLGDQYPVITASSVSGVPAGTNATEFRMAALVNSKDLTLDVTTDNEPPLADTGGPKQHLCGFDDNGKCRS